MSGAGTGAAPPSARWLLRGVRPLGGPPTDLLLDGGVVADAGAGLPARGADVVDADGLVALPGLVDLHTHLREPGREDAETVASGTRAAALGGYTTVFAMANTEPVADTAGVVEQVWRLGREAGHCDVQPVGAVTVGLAGTRLAELGAMASSSAAVRVFSDDGNCVADPLLMRRALEYVKAFDGVIAQHAQEPRLTEDAQMNEGVCSARLGLPGWPAAAEEAIIARDVLLAGHVGSRLHVCHVSTAGSVEIIRWAKSKGWQVSAEVTPHHLLLTDDLVATFDPVYKVNPPLRTAADVAALRAGLADGTIDCVATDHAPHAPQDKETEWAAARPGMLGLETALSIVVETMVEPGLLDWPGVAMRMSLAPARIGRLPTTTWAAARPRGGASERTHRVPSSGSTAPVPPAGGTIGGAAGWRRGTEGPPAEAGTDAAASLAVGAPATLTLFDPAARWTVEPHALASRSRNTPYGDRTLPGRVRATFLRGRPTVLDGKIT